MKKTSAVMGTLASLIAMTASTAMADTSTTTVNATAPKLIDKIIASYWGSYSGPAISNPTRATGDSSTGELDSLQNLDSTFSLGYRLSKDVNVTANYRVVYQPMDNMDPTKSGQNLTTRDPWLAIRHGKLINVGGLNLAADLRLILPVQTSGRMNMGIRSTQITTYDIPGTKLTLGTFTIQRVNFLRENSGMDNLNLSLSGLANYQLTSTVALTGWSDLLSYDLRFDNDFTAPYIPVSLGVNWDITSNLSVNPAFTFFPEHARLNNTTIGAMISARFL